MGALLRGLERKAADPLAVWAEMLKGTQSKSGQPVNLTTAFRVSVFFACLRVISQGCAQVPFKLFRESRVNGLPDIQPAKDHELYDVVATQPNSWSTSFEFRETQAIHAALGRSYAFINRGLGGAIRELILLDPNKVVCEQKDDLSLVYKVTGKSGAVREFPAETIWHVKGPSWNGFEGMDLLNLARDALGLALSTEESHAKLHEKGVHPSGLYSVDTTLNKEQYTALRDWVIKENAGANSGAPMILDRGAKWTQTSMTGIDAQHLETREHQLREVCRFAMVNPIMVYANDKTTTYASAEQMFLSHVVHTMSAWYARIEQSADCHLLTKEERKSGLYHKFLSAGLLRGASKDRAEFYAKALGSGGSPAWMTQDEIRALEELNPFGGEAGVLAEPMNKPAPAPLPDPDAKAQAIELHRATIEALKREPSAPVNNFTLPAITLNPASVKAGDVHVTLPEGAIQVHTTVEPAQIKAGDVNIGPTENHVTVQHPKKSETKFERDPTTLEIKRSETTYETD